MQFEINLNACRISICEMEKAEKMIRVEYEKLYKVYSFFESSDNTSDRELANKIKKELTTAENEIRKIRTLKNSLKKIYDLYSNNEKTILWQIEPTNNHFIIPIEPIPINAISIKDFVIPDLKISIRSNTN